MYNPAERRPTVTTPFSQVKAGAARRSFIMAWLGNWPWIDDEENPICAREDEEAEETETEEDDDDEDDDDFDEDFDDLEDDDDLDDDDEVDDGEEEDEVDDEDDK